MKKRRYKITNWKNYNKALINRGSLTLWFDEKSIHQWHKPCKTFRRGRIQTYSDLAIECMLTLKAVFHLPLRATQGLVMSLITLIKLPIKAANYTTLCRRQKYIEIPLQRIKKRVPEEALHAVFDATGLKVFGEGEWKARQHGYNKRRTWRKLHLGIDETSGEIIAAALTTNDIGDGQMLPELMEQIDVPLSQVSGDGAYDSFENYSLLEKRRIKATIPPRENAKIRQHGNSKDPPLIRDQILRQIRKTGRTLWKKQSGYHRRSIAETTMFRFKKIFSASLNAIIFQSQAVEAFIKCNALNKMTALGMPQTYPVI
jgi:hypothetical protein